MSAFDEILLSSNDIFDKFYKHPFILEIQNSNLNKDKFKYYIIQDYLYLQEYLKIFAIGLAKTNNKELINIFTDSIFFLSQDEMKIHEAYLKNFNIKKDDFKNVKRAIDNLSYTSYMLRVAYEGGELEILAAILSCAISYEMIAKNILKNNPKASDDEFYKEWLKCYSSKEYEQNNAKLVGIFNELAKNYNDLAILKEIFYTCSIYELKFWDLAWNSNFKDLQ